MFSTSLPVEKYENARHLEFHPTVYRVAFQDPYCNFLAPTRVMFDLKKKRGRLVYAV